MVYKKIHDDLYNVDLLYFSGCDVDVAQKKANRVFNIQEELVVEKDEDAAFFTCTTRDNRHVYIIWSKKSRNIPTVTHEIIHLIHEVFNNRGIPTTYKNQEAMAYYMDFWIKQILKRNK